MRRLTALCLLLAGLSGVGVPPAVAQSDDWSEYDTIGASTMTINYTPFRVEHGYAVSRLDGSVIGGGPNGFAGSIERPNGLGSTMCCMRVPRKWKPGIKYRIEWELYPIDPDNEAPDEPWMHWYSAVVELPPYDKIWGFAVQFLPGNRIRVNLDQDKTYPAADDPYIAQGVLDEERTAEAAREYTPERIARSKAYQHRNLELKKIRREQGDEAYWVEVNKDSLAGALEDLKKASPENQPREQRIVEFRREKLRKAEERFATKKKGGE